MIEKRKLKRSIRRCETEFTVGDVSNRGIASDFSGDGLFIKTSRPAAPESVIDLVIYLPDGSVSKVKGRVRWSSRTSMRRGLGTYTKTRGTKNGMGVEILERDGNFDPFIRSLHS